MPCFVPYTVDVQLLYQAFVAHLVKSFRKVHDQDIRLSPGLPPALHYIACVADALNLLYIASAN